MSWQILLVINLILATVRETFSKKLANKLDPYVMVFYIALINGVLLYAYQFLVYQTWPRMDPVVTLSGIIFVIAFVSYYYAVKISLSQSILFQSYSIIVTIVLAAIFLGESRYFDLLSVIGMKTIAGILLAFAALWLLLHQGGKKEHQMERRWFVYMSISILALGVGSFFSVLFSKTYYPVEVFINQTHSMIPLLLGLLVAQKKSLSIPRSLYKILVLNCISAVGAVIAFYEILHLQIAVSRIYPVQQVLLVVLTMISGVLFYKEAHFFTGKRLIGMMVGLGGIILLVMG